MPKTLLVLTTILAACCASYVQAGDEFSAWIFRRYAGEVEMVEKVDYPPTYSGNYYFRPWRRDWVQPGPQPLSGAMFAEPACLPIPEQTLIFDQDLPPAPQGEMPLIAPH